MENVLEKSSKPSSRGFYFEDCENENKVFQDLSTPNEILYKVFDLLRPQFKYQDLKYQDPDEIVETYLKNLEKIKKENIFEHLHQENQKNKLDTIILIFSGILLEYIKKHDPGVWYQKGS